MCFVVVRYYDGICHGLRDQIILIVFNREDDPRLSQRYPKLMPRRFARTESQFSLPGDGNNRQCA